jgi:hypothetical protein
MEGRAIGMQKDSAERAAGKRYKMPENNIHSNAVTKPKLANASCKETFWTQ